MRIQRLDVGLEGISRWQADDEQHLPTDGKLTQRFLPKMRELDQILRRPSLDERLPNLLEPEFVDPNLMDPSVLTDARLGALGVMNAAAQSTDPQTREVFEEVARILDGEVELDKEIRTTLAALLKG